MAVITIFVNFNMAGLEKPELQIILKGTLGFSNDTNSVLIDVCACCVVRNVIKFIVSVRVRCDRCEVNVRRVWRARESICDS